jgi:hypothetical protein
MERSADAVRAIDANPGVIEFKGNHAVVPVDGGHASVAMGVDVERLTSRQEQVAIARQRFVELHRNSSSAADGFARYRDGLDELEAAARNRPAGAPVPVPDASDLHLSARGLGPANPLSPPHVVRHDSDVIYLPDQTGR